MIFALHDPCASDLGFTAIYMRYLVNSYFKEDETGAHVTGQAPQGSLT